MEILNCLIRGVLSHNRFHAIFLPFFISFLMPIMNDEFYDKAIDFFKNLVKQLKEKKAANECNVQRLDNTSVNGFIDTLEKQKDKNAKDVENDPKSAKQHMKPAPTGFKSCNGFKIYEITVSRPLKNVSHFLTALTKINKIIKPHISTIYKVSDTKCLVFLDIRAKDTWIMKAIGSSIAPVTLENMNRIDLICLSSETNKSTNNAKRRGTKLLSFILHKQYDLIAKEFFDTSDCPKQLSNDDTEL